MGPGRGSIAYISATHDDRRGLFLMGPDGSAPHGLAHSKHQDFCFPSWSLDGRTIVFSALNRLGSQGIVVGEEKPRCEQWSGEYQIFAMDDDARLKQLSDPKLMGMHPRTDGHSLRPSGSRCFQGANPLRSRFESFSICLSFSFKSAGSSPR